MKITSKQECEFIRFQAKNKFDRVRGTWCDLLRWGMPYKANWILSQTAGERKNQHIVDPTHILSLRSCVAGFSEGNTSTTRAWARIDTRDSDKNENSENKAWLQHLTQRVMSYLSSSNFYNAAGAFYCDYHVVNTGAHYFQILPQGGFHVYTLIPGAYYVLDNAFGVASILVREFSLNVKALVDQYGVKDKNGRIKWDNFSRQVKECYERSDYAHMVDVVHIVRENPDFDIRNPDDPNNRQWLELTYEVGSARNGNAYGNGNEFGEILSDKGKDVFLKRFTTKRKPFVVGKSTEDFEYGEKGPMLDALGCVKSLNKKAIGKDTALEQILTPTLQGPATLRKSYITSAPNAFIPLDARTMGQKQKVESVFQVNPAIGTLLQDVGDLRQIVDKIFYADFLLFLSRNPKTRTAAETNAIVDEQQRIVGPSLQSLNTTYNVPVLEWVIDYVLFEDPYLKPAPAALAGQSLKPELVSIFASAQKAADLPAIDRYIQAMMAVAQLDPRVFQKVNLDKLADLYEDRLYLPSGLNNPQGKVDAMREQAAQQAQQKAMLEQTLPAVAGAAKDVSAAQRQQ